MKDRVETRFYNVFYISIFLSIISFTCKQAPNDAPEIVTKITGSVINKASGAALSGVQISTLPITSSVSTDATGKFEIPKLSPGTYVVMAAKSGFKDSQINVHVNEGNTANADILMDEQTAELAVTPSFIDFGTDKTEIEISINNSSGIGTIDYSISENSGWLSLSETSGSVTDNVKKIILTADRSLVGFGTFNDVVSISSNVGKKSVNVQMVKRNPNAPQITITPNIIDFASSQNELGVILTNSGTGTLEWTAATNDGWINIEPSSGSITANSTAVKIKVNRNGLAPGSYNGNAIFSSNGGNQTASVKMQISGAPLIKVNPTSMIFGAEDEMKALQIGNFGTGILQWNIFSDKSWLKVNPQSGSSTSAASVSVDRSSLPEGKYNGTLTITSNGGNTEVPVEMHVEFIPRLNISTKVIDFGSAQTQRSFNVTNAGSGYLNWNISTDQDWLKAEPMNGTNNGTVNVTVDRTNLSYGSCSGIIRVNSNGGNELVEVKMNIVPPPGIPLWDMEIIKGKYTKKSNTIIKSIAYPDAVYFDDESITVKLLKEYRYVNLKVGVDDTGGLKGNKKCRIHDDKGNTILEVEPMPLKDPIICKDVDISRADWIEISAADYNGQPSDYIRWIEITFFK
ncbi:MAG: hypothetical protein HF314_14385 [Ignavibacteria bacterium]|jgi:hypothetical protein|nr:hypothetical protein [Ignavibacteria bacterium]MCU7504267.1 hypothetical protein [Ignavibacteria bacterium]MCU7516112.1 hypothetical protein [Ignavibacteria bacterium]